MEKSRLHLNYCLRKNICLKLSQTRAPFSILYIKFPNQRNFYFCNEPTSSEKLEPLLSLTTLSEVNYPKSDIQSTHLYKTNKLLSVPYHILVAS